MRSHFCGQITEALIGQTVTLCGWADVSRNLGGVCFIDLRDHEGIVQVVAEPDNAAYAMAEHEYILPMHRNLGVFTTRQIPLQLRCGFDL